MQAYFQLVRVGSSLSEFLPDGLGLRAFDQCHHLAASSLPIVSKVGLFASQHWGSGLMRKAYSMHGESSDVDHDLVLCRPDTFPNSA